MATYSLLEKLQEDLISIRACMMELLDASTISRAEKNYGEIFVLGPDYYWAPLDSNGLIIQTKVLQSIKLWFEMVEFLIDDKPESIKSNFNENRKFITNWMERNDGADTDLCVKGREEKACARCGCSTGPFAQTISP